MTTAPPALTTPFTPPPACTTQTWWWNDTVSLVQSGTTGTFQYWSLGSTNEASCFPSAWNSATDMYFSPGGCPVGYTLACTRAIQPTEMAGTCCPSSYSCQTQASWPYESRHPCTHSTWNNDFVSILYIGKNGAVQTSSAGLYMGLNAKGVSIRWNPSELVPNTATSGSTAPTGQSSSGASSSSSASSSTTPTSSKQGLSGGAIAGAVIGAIAGVLLIVGLISLLLLAKRKRQHSAHYAAEKQAPHPQSYQQTAPIVEAGGGAVHEIGPGHTSGGRPPSFVHELPASPRKA